MTPTPTSARPGHGRGAARARARGRRRVRRHPRVQLVDSGRAQERARLGVAPDRHERVPQQAGRGDRLERRCVRRRLGCGRAPQGARSDGCARYRGRARRRPCGREVRRRRASWSTTTCARGCATRSRRSSRRSPAELARLRLARLVGGSSSASRRCTPSARGRRPACRPRRPARARNPAPRGSANARSSGIAESIVRSAPRRSHRASSARVATGARRPRVRASFA